ncbi:hypothetical protein HYT57_02030 [Candidatus Woesearchaeota archaeon]|nr:hypothetical protein [Candidatus Woesearchaeota archaeon]
MKFKKMLSYDLAHKHETDHRRGYSINKTRLITDLWYRWYLRPLLLDEKILKLGQSTYLISEEVYKELRPVIKDLKKTFILRYKEQMEIEEAIAKGSKRAEKFKHLKKVEDYRDKIGELEKLTPAFENCSFVIMNVESYETSVGKSQRWIKENFR